MREIKFKAHSPQKGEVVLVDDFYWFEENYVHQNGDGWDLYQYTDLKDKNGKEIYDGDIANSCYGIGQVYINERGARFEFDTDTDGLWEMCTGREGKVFEVIGNIYENPELQDCWRKRHDCSM